MISKKILKCFNDTAIVAFSRIPLGLLELDWASDFLNNLAFYMKDSKLLSLAIFALKSVVSSFE